MAEPIPYGASAELSSTQSSALQLLSFISPVSESAQPLTTTGSEPSTNIPAPVPATVPSTVPSTFPTPLPTTTFSLSRTISPSPSSKVTTTSLSLSTTIGSSPSSRLTTTSSRLSTEINSSPSPTATSSSLPTTAKIGTGVGVPLGVFVMTGLIVLAYRFGQRKERTKSRHAPHPSTENESARAMVDRDGNIHWIGFVPEIDGAEIPIHSRELEGSLGPRRHELP